MRHAKSDWADTSLSDHERSLSERGRHDAPMMAKWLLESGYLPETVVHSTALRCVETVDRMIQAGLNVPSITPLADLYLASPESTLDILRSQSDSGTVMLVGHNPGLSILATQLAQETVEMPTASICVFESDANANGLTSADGFAPTRTKLLSFMRPKVVLKNRAAGEGGGNEGNRDG